MNLFEPGLAPFTTALMLMGLVLLAELVGALIGTPISDLLDGDGLGGAGDATGADVPGMFSGLMSWLCVGRAPLLILLAAFLTCFGIAGLVIQMIVKSIAGFHLWAWLVAIPALAAALPFTRVVGRFCSRLLKREEGDAVSRASFIGRIAVVVRGEARRGFPAEAKLRDLSGASHYVLVEPDEDGAVFSAGMEVLLVEEAGAVFRAIINPSRALSAG